MIARCTLAVIAATLTATRAPAQEPEKVPEKEVSLFTDDVDGAFDVSNFLESRTGFLPAATVITEPAVGFGLAGALAFFHDRPGVVETPNGPRVIPPNVTFVAGGGTENGSWAAGAGHMHAWDDGRVRYFGAGGYASLNLDWFGQSDAFNGRSFQYTIEAWVLVQELTFKLGNSDFFLGPTQRLLDTTSRFTDPPNVIPAGVGDGELNATVSGLGLTLGYDTRDSMFSPTRGSKSALTATQQGSAIGSDFDYTRANFETCDYFPLGGPFVLGVRGEAGYVGDDAPFFDLSSIKLRGIEAGRYVDNVALTIEAELRWDIATRWTLVGFGGTGWVADQLGEIDESKGHPAGGVGFRYLLARKYDLRIGLDLAAGTDDAAVYVTVGTGWVRY